MRMSCWGVRSCCTISGTARGVCRYLAAWSDRVMLFSVCFTGSAVTQRASMVS